MNLLDDCEAQLDAVADFFIDINSRMDRIPAALHESVADEEPTAQETIP
jgi:hypothetical protein